MSRTFRTLCMAAMWACASTSHAAIIGFGQLGGNNTAVPAALASNAVANGNGFVVDNGATPNIALVWDANWDIHTSAFFGTLENLTVGGGAWDNEGNTQRVGQLDFGTHTIDLKADPGYALVLNSFDFAHTGETAGTTVWDLSLTDSASSVVWSQAITFTNGMAVTVTPGFTGLAGADYRLTFLRTSETYNSNGRHGIDNFSFNQKAIPEPAAIVLAVLALLGCGICARR